MTTKAVKSISKPPKDLLALDPQEDSEFKKKVDQAAKKRPNKGGTLTPGVVYVGHLPRALGEKDLKSYFQQFGTVTRLRLAKSKKTGGSKGYAFLEYECDEVAKIVAETMNNYLMRERLIKCQMLTPEQVHKLTFKGWTRKFKPPTFPAVARYNAPRSAEQVAKMTKKLVQKENKLRKRLAAAGVDYDFAGFAAQVPKKPAKEADISTCSSVGTLVCTDSILERRKSEAVEVGEQEDEVVLNFPSDVEDDSDEETEDSSDEVVEGDESETPPEEGK